MFSRLVFLSYFYYICIGNNITMGRIEISLLEYNSMKDRINQLENENVEIRKTNELLLQKLEECQYMLDDVYNSGLIERIFFWKKNILNQIKKIIE